MRDFRVRVVGSAWTFGFDAVKCLRGRVCRRLHRLLSGMASWAEFETAQSDFANRVRKLMSSRKHLTMATLRRDGSPRISGTEVQFTGEHLQFGSMPEAVKGNDLRRDPRVAIHGPTHDPAKSGRWRGEAKVAGSAVE